MRTYILPGILVMVLALHYGQCDTLYVNFNRITVEHFHLNSFPSSPVPKQVKIEAKFDEENDITIIVEQTNVNGSQNVYGEFVLEATSFLDSNVWQSANKSSWFISRYTTQPNQKKYTFFFSRTIGSSYLSNPCAKVDQTNDYFCHFRVKSELVGGKGGLDTPVYLRVHNSAGQAALKLLGGASQRTEESGEITQSLVQETSAVDLGLSLNDPYKFSRWKTLVIKKANPKFLNQVRPHYIYFDCQDGFKKLVIFNTQELNLRGTAEINLARLGLPYDNRRICSLQVVFTDIQSRSSLIPMKVATQVLTFVDPDYSETEIEVFGTKPTIETLLERVNSMQHKLGSLGRIEQVLEDIQGTLKNTPASGRALARKGTRALLSKAIKAAIRRV